MFFLDNEVVVAAAVAAAALDELKYSRHTVALRRRESLIEAKYRCVAYFEQNGDSYHFDTVAFVYPCHRNEEYLIS